MQKVWRLARILSLDVVLGAVASGSLAAYWLKQPMPWIWWLALPLSVWVIYTTDHLLDAYRLKERASTPRHAFHYQYFRPLLLLWGLGLLSCLTWIPWQAPREMWLLGFIMGGLVLAHLGLVYWVGDRISWLFIKELGVGSIYAAGVWGGPLVFAWPDWPTGTLGLFAQFWLMALINLLFFSLYERHIDEQDGHSSFVRAIGPQRARQLIGLLVLLVLVLGLTLCLDESAASVLLLKVQAVYLLMLSLLSAVSFAENRFRPQERYRIWGDAAFLLPALVWLFA